MENVNILKHAGHARGGGKGSATLQTVDIFFFFEIVACSVLSVAKCLLYAVMTFSKHKNKKDALMI
jgi:hypothetical protein